MYHPSYFFYFIGQMFFHTNCCRPKIYIPLLLYEKSPIKSPMMFRWTNYSSYLSDIIFCAMVDTVYYFLSFYLYSYFPWFIITRMIDCFWFWMFFTFGLRQKHWYVFPLHLFIKSFVLLTSYNINLCFIFAFYFCILYFFMFYVHLFFVFLVYYFHLFSFVLFRC